MNRERPTVSLRRYHQLAVVCVVGIAVLVVAGGIVRLTGSGLGCDDWPACNESSFVDVSSTHTAIEQLNRLLSALIGIPVLALAVCAPLVRPRRHGLVGPSIGVLVSVLANGVVGGIAVRGDLHPMLVQSHFLLAIVSITFAMLAVHRSSPEPAQPEACPGRAAFWAFGVFTAAALVTGTIVTGTGPHAGDEDARRFGFDISTVARIHSAAVWVAVASCLVLLAVLRRGGVDRAHRSRISTWLFLAAVQGGVGYVQYANGVPEILVGAHLAGATALWIATVHVILGGIEPPAPCTDGHTADSAGGVGAGGVGMSFAPSPHA